MQGWAADDMFQRPESYMETPRFVGIDVWTPRMDTTAPISQKRKPRRAVYHATGQSITEPREFLPAIVRERFVGFRHAVGVFLLLDRVSFALARGDHFGGELLGHRFLVAAA
jgi:hypothetical protein